jgi:hypothetical protein
MGGNARAPGSTSASHGDGGRTAKPHTMWSTDAPAPVETRNERRFF